MRCTCEASLNSRVDWILNTVRGLGGLEDKVLFQGGV